MQPNFSLPCHRDELIRLRRRLLDWREETYDLLLNPWTREQPLENVKI
ncbi:MAG: hypothetical protein KC419_07390 [Anaerolineales bacterium]|nr:hypothetical protein [Anaerolineales bacterium]MCA9928281.1 hypothetical protein [Anaerolineales bacterium]